LTRYLKPFCISVSVLMVMAIFTSCSFFGKLDSSITKKPKKIIAVEKPNNNDANLLARNLFNAQGQKVYDDICSTIENQQKTYKFDVDLTIDSVKKIILAIQADKPEYFWFENYTWFQFEGDPSVDRIEMKYNCDLATRKAKQAKIDTYYSSFRQTVADYQSDYEKIKAAHDYIILNTDYVLNSTDNQNICSVFIYGKSVCAGYAKATQYLLQKLGIEVAYVTGEAIGKGSHAWNIVKSDGDYYFIDVTWDDPSFSTEQNKSNIRYNFFNITSAELALTHKIEGNILKFPVCTATKDNYFVKENLYFDNLDTNSVSILKTQIMDAIYSGQTSYSAKFLNQKLMEEALSEITKFDAFAGSEITYSFDKENFILIVFL